MAESQKPSNGHQPRYEILAIGLSKGQTKLGVENGPKALFEAGLVDQLKTDLHLNLNYDGNINTYENHFIVDDTDIEGMKHPRFISKATQEVHEQIYSIAKKGIIPISLGGDHSIAIGTLTGNARAVRERLNTDMAIIWVDAHADINRPQESLTGNIHGMPVAFASGLAKNSLVFDWIKPDSMINVKKLVYVGLRQLDGCEKKTIQQERIKAFSMHDIDRYGIGKIMDMAMDYIGRTTPIHLSFDVDALDPMWAPSTGTPVRGGLTLREGDFIAECVAATGNLIGLDLVEINPSLEKDGAAATVRAGLSILRCAVGETLL